MRYDLDLLLVEMQKQPVLLRKWQERQEYLEAHIELIENQLKRIKAQAYLKQRQGKQSIEDAKLHVSLEPVVVGLENALVLPHRKQKLVINTLEALRTRAEMIRSSSAFIRSTV